MSGTYSNRSSAHEWFRHDGGGAPVGPARISEELITAVEKAAAQDLRNQFLKRQQEKEHERKREQEESKAISKRERELLDEQNRKEAELREKQRQQLKRNLDQQIEEKRMLKAKEAEEASRHFMSLQEDLNAWKRSQEDEKQKRIQQSKQLHEERLALLTQAEQKKAEDAQRKKEYQKKLADNFASYLQEQEMIRKKQFLETGAGILNDQLRSIDSFRRSTASASASASAASSPFSYSSSSSSSACTAAAGTPASSAAYQSLVQQIEERKKIKEQNREAELAYAAQIQRDIADAKAEEDAKLRKVREKNLLYKSYLEKQMEERTRILQQRQAEENAPLPREESIVASTRPW